MAGLFLIACFMTFEYYSSDHSIRSISGSGCRVCEAVFGHVYTTVAAGVLWCLFAQCAEAFIQVRFFRQLLAKMMDPETENRERRQFAASQPSSSPTADVQTDHSPSPPVDN